MAFKITLTTPAPITIGIHGVGVVGLTGQGMPTPSMANAVSALSQPDTMPHGPKGDALTGIAEGAQKNKAAIVIVATILRSFMAAPQLVSSATLKSVIYARAENVSSETNRLRNARYDVKHLLAA